MPFVIKYSPRQKKLIIYVCVFLAVIVGVIFYYEMMKPKPPTEIMAWVYPGEPACNAKAEYSDGRMLDIIKSEYFMVDQNGDLNLLTEQKDGCNAFSLTNISDIKKYSKSQYVTVSDSSLDSTDIFIQKEIKDGVGMNTLVKFVNDNNMNGVEIDFENYNFWSKDQYLRYRQFITKFGNELHKNNKKLMIDGPAISSTKEESNLVWRYQDFINLPVDKIVVLAYDYQFDNGPGKPVTPIFWLKDVIKYTTSKYPIKKKISIGIPSYGYKGDTVTGKITLLTYNQMKMESGFDTAKRDSESYEMTWKSGTSVYFFQDGESMLEKRKVVESTGIYSISVWHLGGNLWFPPDNPSINNK
jgi:spore germination protein YaaH